MVMHDFIKHFLQKCGFGDHFCSLLTRSTKINILFNTY